MILHPFEVTRSPFIWAVQDQSHEAKARAKKLSEANSQDMWQQHLIPWLNMGVHLAWIRITTSERAFLKKPLICINYNHCDF